jgi:hypothetical protein
MYVGLSFCNNVHDKTYVGDEDDDDREGQMVLAWCLPFWCVVAKKVKYVHVAAVTGKVGRRYFRVRFRSPAHFSTPTAFPRASKDDDDRSSFLSTRTNAPSRNMIHLLRKLPRCWSELETVQSRCGFDAFVAFVVAPSLFLSPKSRSTRCCIC